MNTVCVLGLGSTGLTTAIIAAESGWSVTGFDSDEHRIAAINAYESFIKDSTLTERLQRSCIRGAFKASISPSKSMYYIIAVPITCSTGKTPDLQALWHTAQLLSAVIQPGSCIIITSIIPVGATEKFAEKIQNLTGLRAGIDFFCAYSPERMNSKNYFKELITTARIIGGINRASIEKAQQFYVTFVQGALHLTQARTAELVTLLENSYNDIQVAFAHTVTQLAETTNTNPYELIELTNNYSSASIAWPTSGTGGNATAIDPWYLINSFPRETGLLQTARLINEQRPLRIICQLRQKLLQDKNCTLLLLGCTNKPDSEDIRDSSALLIAKTLTHEFPEQIRVCDPHLHDTVLIQHALQPTSIHEGMQWAQALVMLVDHTIFKRTRNMIMIHTLYDYCGFLCSAQSQENTPFVNTWHESASIFEKQPYEY